jgi:pyrroline-5-carboxylate reductase
VKKTDALKGLHLSFIGAGAMAEAMIGGLLSRHQLEPKYITASDRHPERLRQIRDAFHIHTTLDNVTAAKKGQVVVLAVKPQVLPAVFRELHGAVRKNALVLSIVAGTTIESIATGLMHRAIVRTMPNTPAQVGEGMTVWVATPEVSDAQREQATAIVAALGHQLYAEDEKFLDMATAISGSGPAYVFLMMEALMDAAVHLGFSRADSRELVVQTIRGAAVFAEKSSAHPAEMRNMVTSPGGTSADALYQLEKGAFRTVLSKAVLAAYQRSAALGQMGQTGARPKAEAKPTRASSDSDK